MITFQSAMNPAKRLNVDEALDGDAEVEIEFVNDDRPEEGGYLYLARTEIAALRDHLTKVLGEEDVAEAQVVDEATAPEEKPEPEVVRVLLPVDDLPLHYAAQVFERVLGFVGR